jgi:hypothetical protein
MEFARQSEYADLPQENEEKRTESEYTNSGEGRETLSMSGEEKAEYEELEKELQEEKQPKKPLARVIPAFIDLIIIGA